VIFEAPAKLNLSLRVPGKRTDGFHEIDSVMVALPGLADRLAVEPAESDFFECDAPGVPVDDSNLVLRAVRVFREATGRGEALRIRLDKRIPHGAGLGGGSSDAAAMLSGLDKLLGTELGDARLREMAAGIGSDVPFFLGPPVARVRGRGERIGPGPALPPLPVVLLKPSFGVPTPEAYGRWRDAPAPAGVDLESQVFEWGELVNDLERPVFSKHLFLAEMKEWLRQRPEVAGALMSGSGSTMFAVVHGLEGAEELVEAARAELDPTLWAWMGSTADGGGN
jgi:4-diphosphocytidyl-2-C-methyl-D-erythritol kinase